MAVKIKINWKIPIQDIVESPKAEGEPKVEIAEKPKKEVKKEVQVNPAKIKVKEIKPKKVRKIRKKKETEIKGRKRRLKSK